MVATEQETRTTRIFVRPALEPFKEANCGFGAGGGTCNCKISLTSIYPGLVFQIKSFGAIQILKSADSISKFQMSTYDSQILNFYCKIFLHFLQKLQYPDKSSKTRMKMAQLLRKMAQLLKKFWKAQLPSKMKRKR